MRSSTLTPLLLASACAHSLPELSVSKRDTHTNGATNHFRRSIGTHQLQKRQGTLGTNIFNVRSWSAGGAYYANVTVGTPPQPQTLIVDTGSSDTYFDASSASECQLASSDPNSCQGGTFDSSKSNTYKELDPSPTFNASYGDGSTAIGPYGEDVLGIGSLLISPVQFGVAEQIDSGTDGYSIGLMGLGYTSIEAVPAERYLYQNIPEVLKDAGVINSRLYSVYLNDDSALQGSVLFGGVDRTKYTGDLATVNFLPFIYEGVNTGLVNQFITTITAANVTSNGQTTPLWSGGAANINAYNDDSSLPVLLDTGSTAWSVPRSYVDPLASALGLTTNDLNDDGLLSCAHARTGDHLSLEFGGKVTIQVDVSEFIVPLINTTTRQPVMFDENNEGCILLIQPDDSPNQSGTGFWIAGDALLRSMYVVFDLDNGQASIAQAALNVTSQPDVVTVAAGPNGVAEAISGVQTAPANAQSIVPEISAATSAFTVETATAPIGTSTGPAAIPGAAQESTGAAVAVVVPSADFTGFWISFICIVGVALGAGVML